MITSHIVFGALAPPLHEQLSMDPASLKAAQRDADAVSRLCVSGILTEAEAHRVRERLVKRIAALRRRP